MSSTLFNSTVSDLPLPPLAGFWFGEGASNMVDSVDSLFAGITTTGAIVFACLIVMWVWFCWRYRMRPGHAAEPSPSHNDKLEVTWTVIPCVIFGIIFFFGFRGFMDMRNAPDDAYEIHVTAAKWSWSFRYPNGLVMPELHVPVNRPVLLRQESSDVLHSLYIPAFRIKMDCVPGRYTYQWFEATKTGRYDLFCAEYCGTNHSNMYAPVFVETEEEFQAFLAKDPNEGKPDVEAGEWLYTARGCSSCHSTDGTAKQGGGPSFKGSFGTERRLQGGGTVIMDENYIRESILQPNAKIHDGYEPRMPSFQGQINDDDLRRLIAFIKSLRNQEQ
jgi:cytochrome c oxidase subunit 2